MRRLFEIRPVRTVAVLLVALGLLTFAGFAVLISALHLPALAWWIPPAVAVVMAAVFAGMMLPAVGPCLVEIDRMRAGQAWVHWTYDGAEWAMLARLEDRRIRRYLVTAAVVPAVAGVVLLFTSAVVAGIVILGAAAVVAVVCLSARRIVGQRADAGGGEVYLNGRGVDLVPGGFQPLFGIGGILADVTLDELPGPPMIRFVTAQKVTRRSRTPESAADVLIPAGQLEAARQLVARYDTEVLGRPAVATPDEPVRRLPSHLFDE